MSVQNFKAPISSLTIMFYRVGPDLGKVQLKDVVIKKDKDKFHNNDNNAKFLLKCIKNERKW